MKPSRMDDVQTFYSLLARLTVKNPPRQMASTTARSGWPDRGVYFFFEDGENRCDGTPRVVRIGTHGLIEGASTTLWQRLSQHRGTLTPKGGNHRGSVFRDLVGKALMAKNGMNVETWGNRKISTVGARASERAQEEAVSDHIGAMSVAWLDVPDSPGPGSLRGYIERNAIALISNYGREIIDPPSPNWLGLHSDRDRVCASGIWNNNHVAESHDPVFLKVFEALIEEEIVSPGTQSVSSEVPPIIVMQCAKSKREGGRFLMQDGTALGFVTDPTLAPPFPNLRHVHPDDEDQDGVSWRQRVLDYNKVYSETGLNPFGLHSAAELYTNVAYGGVRDRTPADHFYILSACWGLVRSDWLLPNYDVSFSHSQSVPPHAIRAGGRHWQDFNMIDLTNTAPMIFVGGKAYLAAFERLSRDYQGPRIVYHNLAVAPELDGIEIRRFDTVTRTNWHYALARQVADDQNPPPPGAAKMRHAPNSTARRGKLGKYSALSEYLSNIPSNQMSVTMTFSEIEKVLGAPLPPSSRSHMAQWWSNGGHSQANSWLHAGFRKVAHHSGSSDERIWVRFERME